MNSTQTKILIVVLATVVPVTLATIAAVVLCRRYRRRKSLFNRGITPIGDEEIESWKTDKADEKSPIVDSPIFDHSQHQQHQRQQSSISIKKPPSVIVYQNGQARASEETYNAVKNKHSMDMPATPVLARAPNARPGLTDDTVQGEDAYISPLKRQPSRLAKLPPTARQGRTRNSRSSTISAPGHHSMWHGHQPEHSLTRMSSDFLPRANRSFDLRRQKRGHSISTPPRMSFDDDAYIGGLSPRPLIRKFEIGRAIG
ncbi:hypothetical protein BGZ63DRAFT_5513 [Mariannaea sp. PMI_226]|nr:hypothetical protein BGZ63DRAFT_5513 [Mariannaea sp. PMI_226]